MTFKKTIIAFAVLMSSVAAHSVQVGAGIKQEDADAFVDKLKVTLPQLQVEKLSATPIQGLYEVISQGQVIYVSKDGNYLIDGKLYDIALKRSLTDESIAREMNPRRLAAMATVDESTFITFKAPNEKHKIVVFTDVDCPYCQKFHYEVPQLNALGVTVQYAAFPRAGKGSMSYQKMVSVWCADDQQKAMDVVKGTRNIDIKLCDNHPVDQHLALVPQLGIRGTPAIVLQDGQVIPGYKPAMELFKQLEAMSPSTPATPISAAK